MASGVGKTYKMLEEGYALQQEGIDIVIGLLETYGGKETAEKAEGLEVIPPQLWTHGDVMLPDMNTEAVIERLPQFVLIDELAHTNVSGCLRAKPHEDVEIISYAGIYVYSSMNVQHLESLNDLVARITGVVLRERIPDRILEATNEVILVDITPDTLQVKITGRKNICTPKYPRGFR
jgi:two-component system sensor histidine kinase KdpD